MEIWRPVIGYETLYEVSNFGNVRRIARGKLFNAKQVAEAKKMLADGAKLKEVAAFLGTSVTTVMSIKHNKTWQGDPTSRPLKLGKINTGYLSARLCVNGKYVYKLAHRLVWESFNGPISDRLEINHKDLDKTNNRLSNLELVTHQQNLIHVFSFRKRKPNKPKLS